MSEASWISPDEGLIATQLARCPVVIKDIDKPVFAQNHYFSTEALLAIKMSAGSDKIRKAVAFAVSLSGSVCAESQKQGHFGTINPLARALLRGALPSSIARKVAMPEPQSSQSQEQKLIESLPAMTLEQWLEKLRRADRAFYNIMAMEVWSIAKTMDDLIPGFWGRFMTNRHLAMKQFIEQRRLQRSKPEMNQPPAPPSKSSLNP